MNKQDIKEFIAEEVMQSIVYDQNEIIKDMNIWYCFGIYRGIYIPVQRGTDVLHLFSIESMKQPICNCNYGILNNEKI